jgi:hypothetical protein
MGTVVVSKKTGEEKEMFSTRLTPPLLLELKIYSSYNRKHIHEVVEAAIKEYIRSTKGKRVKETYSRS